MKDNRLQAAALAARSRAYAPYSGFLVGAALLTAEGALVTGSNTENASFAATVCAERSAIWTAVHAGYRRFTRLAVAADCSPPPFPCGICLQVLWELSGNIEIVAVNPAGETRKAFLLELLAEPFGREKWAENPAGPAAAAEEIWRLPVSFHPVGYIHNHFNEPGKMPDNYKEFLSRVVIDVELEKGLYRLEEEERITVIAYLHLAGGYTLKERRSGRGNEVYGIFACRAPQRPNFIAQSTVDLVERKGNILVVRGADLVNGTPVLDIKTVYP